MENPWVPYVRLWLQKLENGEPIDFTIDTKDKQVFEAMGREMVEKIKIVKHLAPLPHQGDFSKCKAVLLLGHIGPPGYYLPDIMKAGKLNLYSANLLQRPLHEGEPIRGLSLSLGGKWWSQRTKPLVDALQDRGKSREEAQRLLEEGLAVLQVHPYSSKLSRSTAEPPELKATMDYSLQLARKAIERGALAFVCIRWRHWDDVLGLSRMPNVKLLRMKRSRGNVPHFKEKDIDKAESNVTYDHLLDALSPIPNPSPAPSLPTKKRKRSEANSEIAIEDGRGQASVKAATVPKQKRMEAPRPIKEKASDKCKVPDATKEAQIQRLKAELEAAHKLNSDLRRRTEAEVEERRANLKAVETELDNVKAELRDLTAKNRDLTEENRDLAAYVDAKGNSVCAICEGVWSDERRRGMFNGCAHVDYCSGCAIDYMKSPYGTENIPNRPPKYRCPSGCVLESDRVLVIARTF